MIDPYDASYDELRAQNRTALDASLRDLSVLAALLVHDGALVEDNIAKIHCVCSITWHRCATGR